MTVQKHDLADDAGVENAGQACMEREMTKNRKFSLIDNRVV